MQRLGADTFGALSDFLSTHDDLIAAWCFGSQARQRPSCPRDLDLAVLGERPFDLTEMLTLRAPITRIVRSDKVDLVDLRRAGPVLKRQVIASGRRFFCRDESRANAFELQALAEYQDSHHRRREQARLLRAGLDRS